MARTLTSPTAMLSIDHVTLAFGATRALHDVTLNLPAGRICALLGENGAGKSTLGRVLAGIQRPDAGEVTLDGMRLRQTPAAARAHGIRLVHQEQLLWPELTVEENVALPATGGLLRRLDRAALRGRARRALDAVAPTITADRIVGTLSPADRALVQVAAGLAAIEETGRPGTLILDEPTTSLGPTEVAGLLSTMRRLCAAGHRVIFISHRLSEVFAVADDLVVMRDGAIVLAVPTRDAREDSVLHAMVGRDIPAPSGRNPLDAARARLEVRGLGVRGRLRDASLSVRPGEIVGLAGLNGAGRTTMLEAIFGLVRRQGEIAVDGEFVPPGNPALAVRAGLALVPEERGRSGLFQNLSIAENLSLTAQRVGRLRRGDIAPVTAALARCRVRAPSAEALPGQLSGGNQQKVLLARWMMLAPKVLLLDEPTRGVDVGAKADLHDLIRELASGGAAVLVASSDLPELLTLCDRIIVLRAGAIEGTLDARRSREIDVLCLATGSTSAGTLLP